jgi:rhodanese-related sulfurtransferase
MAAGFLLQEGIDAVNVDGGVDRWSREVEEGMPRY